MLVVGADNLASDSAAAVRRASTPRAPALFEDQRFADDCDMPSCWNCTSACRATSPTTAANRRRPATRGPRPVALVQAGAYEAALYFPPDFAARLDAFRKAIQQPGRSHAAGQASGRARRRRSKCPAPKSSTTRPTTSRSSPSPGFPKCCGRWTERIGDDNLRSQRRVGVGDAAVLGGHVRRGRRQAPQRRRCGRRSCPCCCCSGR